MGPFSGRKSEAGPNMYEYVFGLGIPSFFGGYLYRKKLNYLGIYFALLHVLLRFIYPLPKELIHVTLHLPTPLIWCYTIKRSNDLDWANQKRFQQSFDLPQSQSSLLLIV